MEKELTWKLCWYLLTHGLLAWVQISFPFLTLKLGHRGAGVSGDPNNELPRGSGGQDGPSRARQGGGRGQGWLWGTHITAWCGHSGLVG